MAVIPTKSSEDFVITAEFVITAFSFQPSAGQIATTGAL